MPHRNRRTPRARCRLMPIAAALAAACAHAAAPDDLFDPLAAPTLRFDVVALPSLGGGSSLGSSIDHQGRVAGRSNLPGNQTRHATLWRGTSVTDLGTLGGPNSAVLWPVKNARGVVSGIAQTAEPDPNGETWSCGVFFPAAFATGVRCLGFRWRDGVMTALPTLGGTHGFATGTNDALRTVGWAENTTVDPTCTPPQKLQFRAVTWGPDGRVERELVPLSGDGSSAATAINRGGQAVGISGDCDQAVGRYTARHAVVWNGGVPSVIPTFGGVAWNTPMAINDRGEVAGFANASAASGGDFDPRAFVWSAARGTRPLPALAGHVATQASSLNDRGHAVGQSCDAAGDCRAVLWRGNRVLDLNAAAGAASTLLMFAANDIDDRGRITGQAYDTASGRYVAFVATPSR